MQGAEFKAERKESSVFSANHCLRQGQHQLRLVLTKGYVAGSDFEIEARRTE